MDALSYVLAAPETRVVAGLAGFVSAILVFGILAAVARG